MAPEVKRRQAASVGEVPKRRLTGRILKVIAEVPCPDSGPTAALSGGPGERGLAARPGVGHNGRHGEADSDRRGHTDWVHLCELLDAVQQSHFCAEAVRERATWTTGLDTQPDLRPDAGQHREDDLRRRRKWADQGRGVFTIRAESVQ